MNDQQFIPCPTKSCSGKILFDSQELLRGAQFLCPVCSTAVGLAPESREVVYEATEKFNELKQKVGKNEKR